MNVGMNHIAALFFCWLLLTGCQKPGCLESAGPVITREQSGMVFQQIDLYDNIHLVLTQDTAEKIWVEAGRHLQPNIETTVQKGILTIRNHTGCQWLRKPSEKITVYLSLKKLTQLNYQGSGTVTTTNTLQADTLNFYSDQGAGIVHISIDAKLLNVNIQHESPDLIVQGTSESCHAYVDSRGTIDFSNFQVRHMVMGYTSVRNATIQVTEDLYAKIFHSGNLFLRGRPSYIDTTYYSTGRLYLQP